MGFPPLLVWHSVNLLNLIGGAFSSLLQIYSTSNVGLMMTIYNISPGGDCPDDDAAVDYCSDGFLYLVLHILAFFVVIMRVVHSYGGEDEKPIDGVTNMP